MKYVLLLLTALHTWVACLPAQTSDPRLASWLFAPSGSYARIFTTDAAKSAGTSVTTWSLGQGVQTTPSYAGMAQVSSSANWVYVRSSGLGYHVMGPWYLNAAHTQAFPNYPANTGTLYRIPRTPAVPATKTLTGGGAIGYGVDGVALFDNRDTFSYSTANAQDASPTGNFGRGDGVWNRDAYVNEGVTFDAALAHQAGALYHYHANMPALRYEVGDHVDYNASTKNYTESSGLPAKHSPIIGWLADGFPVYGPYGYASAMNASSGLRRMVSGYVKRDGTNGTTNLASTGRTTLPAWAALAQGTSATLAATSYGPAVNTTYTLGHFLEDYDYLGDLGKTQSVDFDLDQYNGRFCVTPEFPGGTYAYFVSIEADSTPKFPYMVGRWYYGSPAGGVVASIAETVTEFVRGAPAAAINVLAAASASGVTLTWNSAERATYKVESSPDNTAWTTLSAAVMSGGTVTSYVAPVAKYYRITLSAIATYDTDGQVGTAVGTTGSLQYSSTSNPPSATIALTSAAAVNVPAGKSVSVSATSSNSSYQWQVSVNAGAAWTNVSDGTVYSGATTQTLTLTNASSALSGNLYRALTDGTVASGNATLTVYPALVGFASGLALDGSGNFYATDAAANVAQKITSTGAVSLVAGSSGTAGNVDGTGTAAQFSQPAGVTASATFILTIADAANGLIRRVSAAGVVTTLAGSAAIRGGTDGTSTAATFSAPNGIAQSSDGTLYVADAGNHTVRKITAAGVVTTVAGVAGQAGSTDGAGSAARFSLPHGIAVDASGNLYVADTGNSAIRKISTGGVVSTLAGLAGVVGSADSSAGGALFNFPEGVAVDNAGSVYVADTGNALIRKVTPAGVVTTLAGLAGISGLKDGAGSNAWFNQPKALALDSGGNLYVADSGNGALRQVTPAGVVTSIVQSVALVTPSTPATPTTPTVPTTSSGTTAPTSSGGGGGAMSHWLVTMLALLLLLRFQRPTLQPARGSTSM